MCRPRASARRRSSASTSPNGSASYGSGMDPSHHSELQVAAKQARSRVSSCRRVLTEAPSVHRPGHRWRLEEGAHLLGDDLGGLLVGQVMGLCFGQGGQRKTGWHGHIYSPQSQARPHRYSV